MQHVVQRVHGHRDGRVADGVDSELPAELVAFLDVGVDLLRREERPPAESRQSLVVHQRPSRRAGESTVGRHLADRADTQPVVAVARLLSEFLQLRRARPWLLRRAKDIRLEPMRAAAPRRASDTDSSHSAYDPTTSGSTDEPASITLVMPSLS